MKDSRVNWARCPWFVALLSIAAVVAEASAQNRTPLDIKSLMEQLSNPREVRPDTVNRIVIASEKDPSAREFVIQKLPELIRGPGSDLWLDAIRLAGKLKAKEAIPALREAMSRPPFPAESFMTFSGTTRLENDIVAKTLAEIGDASIPTAKSLLKAKDDGTRWRAILILRNIGSPAAHKVLEDHLSRETNIENKKLIEDSLHS